MGLFKQRKNKRFNHIPRRHNDSAESDERVDEDAPSKLKEDWEAVRGHTKQRGKSRNTLPLLLVGLGMIIVIWYLLTHYETT